MNTPSPRMPLVSIIVPVYNPGEYFAPCLASLAAQQYPNFEVLLMEDGSTDGSAAAADSFCQNDSRFVVFHAPNRGAAAARADGLRRANGDYVILMDSDDLVHPQMLTALVAACTEHSVPLAFCRFAPFAGKAPADDAVPKSAELLPKGRHLEMLLHDKRLEYALSNKLFRRGVITPEMLECPYRYNEDLLAAWRAFRGVAQAAFADFDGYHCRQHAGSTSHGGITPAFITDQWQVAKLILADAAGTPVQQSAESFYTEKLIYLCSMIARQKNAECAPFLPQLRAELKARRGWQSVALCPAHRLAAFLCCFAPPLFFLVCRIALRDRR